MRLRWWTAALLLTAGRAAAQDVPNASFYLVNRSDSAIARVFATPTGMATWGSDRLTAGAVAPGRNAPIRLPADGRCRYDVRVVYAGGRSEERRDLDLCEIDDLSFPLGSGPAPPRSGRAAENPSFLLVNRSRTAINEVYLSLSGDDSWGEDRLGEGTLPGGASRTFRLPPGECIYDVRVVFANGDANEKRRLDLCQITDLRVP